MHYTTEPVMPLGSEETQRLAIAAVCGTVIGAVAGAVGYAVANRTPSQSRRNSCASCLERPSPKHSPSGHALPMLNAGDGDPVMYRPDFY